MRKTGQKTPGPLKYNVDMPLIGAKSGRFPRARLQQFIVLVL